MFLFVDPLFLDLFILFVFSCKLIHMFAVHSSARTADNVN